MNRHISLVHLINLKYFHESVIYNVSPPQPKKTKQKKSGKAQLGKLELYNDKFTTFNIEGFIPMYVNLISIVALLPGRNEAVIPTPKYTQPLFTGVSSDGHTLQ